METPSSTAQQPYGFGPLVEECRRRGINRSVAYVLVARGLLDTFKIGHKRYVRLHSLESLPDRLASNPHPPD